MLLFGVYMVILFSVPFFFEDRHLYIYAGILILLSFSFTDWFYSGLEEFRGITLRSVLIKLISLLLLYVFVKTEADFANYMFTILFSIIGNQLLSFVMVFRKTKFVFSGLNFRKHMQPLLYIFSATVAGSMYTVLDTVLLGFLSTDEAVGLYTAAVKLIKITIPIVTSLGIVLIPSISKNFARNNMDEIKALLAKSFNFLVFLSIPLGLGLAILAPEFIIIFSGNKFIDAVPGMQILSLLPALIGFGHFFCFQILMPFGMNKEIFFSMLAGVFTCLILNFILVPFLNQTGAAIANVVTETVVTCSYFYYLRKQYIFHYNWRFAVQSFISALIFLPLILLIRYFDLKPIITLLLSVGTCAAIYTAIQLFVFKNSFLFSFITPLKNKLWLYKPLENE